MKRRVLLIALAVLMGDLKVAPMREAWAAADHVVISEFATQAPDRNRDGKVEDKDQFVELYNPTAKPVDLTNWRIYHLLLGSTFWGQFDPPVPEDTVEPTKMIVEISIYPRVAVAVGGQYFVQIDSTQVDDRWAGSRVQIPSGGHFLIGHATTTKGLSNYFATLDVADPALRRAILNPGNVDADLYWFDKTIAADQPVPVPNYSNITYTKISSAPAISAIGSALALVRPTQPGETPFLVQGSSSFALVDMVGWGDGAAPASYETARAPLQTTQDIKSLQTFESIARKAEAEDTNNNALDFAIRATRGPQNLKTPRVRPGAVIEPNLIVSPAVFSPEKAGRERTSITWQTPPEDTVTLKVFDRMGRLVIPLAEREPGGVRTLAWDGRDTLGAIVPIGYYIVSLEVFDVENQRVTHKEAVVVIATPLKD